MSSPPTQRWSLPHAEPIRDLIAGFRMLEASTLDGAARFHDPG